MGTWPSKIPATSPPSTPAPSWAALMPKLLLLVFRRLSSYADRVRFTSVCRHWRHITRSFIRWSDLPPKIADLIVRRLPAEADRIRFASVCRHWRDVASKFRSPWSSILPELGCLILRRLMYSHADRVRFAAVCRHWRYIARQYSPALPPALPWLCCRTGITGQSLPDGERYYLCCRKQEILSGSFMKQERCYGPFGNWLLMEETDGNHQFLKNPLSGATVRLPTGCKEPAYRYFNGSQSKHSKFAAKYFKIKKVVVCTGDLIAAIVSYPFCPRAVVCCRPGMPSWSIGLCNDIIRYHDMAVHLGNLYAIANEGELFMQEVTEDSDTREPKVSRVKQVIWAPPLFDCFYWTSENRIRYYLVISLTGKLLLIRWFVPFCYSLKDVTKDLKMKVYEADLVMSAWVEVGMIKCSSLVQSVPRP